MKAGKIFSIFLIAVIALGAWMAGVANVLGQQFFTDSENLREISGDKTRTYDQAKIFDAWERINEDNSADLKNVAIGIIDSGIDAEHPEFEGVDIKTSVVSDSEEGGHGTQVAGIIGANNLSFPNPNGYTEPHMNGILSGVHNLDYGLGIKRRPQPQFSFPLFGLASRVKDLKNQGVDVINMSFHSTVFSGPIESMFGSYERLFNKNSDILFVVVAGLATPDFFGLDAVDVSFVAPASLGDSVDNVITVGGVDRFDSRINFSNFGAAVGIAAPTEGIYAPAPRGQGNFPTDSETQKNYYETVFGLTSGAAPFVTGVAGLLKAINPDLTPFEIKTILVETSDPIDTRTTEEIENNEPGKLLGTGCYDSNNNPQNFTGCRLNAHTAVCHEKALNCEEETSQEESIFYDFEDGTAGAPLQTSPLWEKSGGFGSPNIVFTSNNPSTGNLAGFVNQAGVIAPSGSYLYQGPASIVDDRLYKTTLWFRHENQLNMQPNNDQATNYYFAGFRLDARYCGVTFSTQNSDNVHVHAGLTIGSFPSWTPQSNTFLGYLPNEWTPVRITANTETGDCTASLLLEGEELSSYTQEKHIGSDPTSSLFIIASGVNAVIYDPWHVYMDDFGKPDPLLNSHLGEE